MKLLKFNFISLICRSAIIAAAVITLTAAVVIITVVVTIKITLIDLQNQFNRSGSFSTHCIIWACNVYTYMKFYYHAI